MTVTVDQMKSMLREAAVEIERGGVQSVTIRYYDSAGNEHEYVISVATQEERDIAIASIRSILGELH